MKKRRYEALDGLRAFSCIGIVMMHVLSNGKYQLEGFIFDSIIHSFTDFVFLFMTISAFGMCCGYYDRFSSGNIDLVAFYKKRYVKILPFFSLLCLLDIAMSPSLNALYETIANLTLCFGFIPNANITVIGVGWFLGVVFAFYIMFPFYCSLLSNRKKAWIVLVISYVMNYLCRVRFDADRTSIVYCFVYFVVGGLVFLYHDELCGLKGVKWISLIVAIISALSYYFVMSGTPIKLLFSAAILIFSISLDGKNVLNNRFTKFVGGISFEIYLCHMVIFRCVERVHLLRLFNNDYLNYALSVLLVFGGAVFLAVIAQKAISMMNSRIQLGNRD